MKMFRTNLGTQIKEFEVIKKTKCRITYKSPYYKKSFKTEGIEGKYACWHNTFEEAKMFLIKRSQDSVSELTNKLDYEKIILK
jgi:hypothetical protein